MNVAYSKNGVPIRLSFERWTHIVENHDDMASSFHDVLDTIENPEIIMRGYKNSLKAVQSRGRKRKIVVVYKELSKVDGFVITAYYTESKLKGVTLWHR